MHKKIANDIPLLRHLCEEGLSYADIGAVFGLTYSAITYRMKKYLPDIFYHRQVLKGKWRAEFLPSLKNIIAGGGSFYDVARTFDVSLVTARDWVRRFLGQAVFDAVPRKARRYHPPAVKERARMLRRQGYTLKQISSMLDRPVSVGIVSLWCKGVSPDIDEEGEPSDEDLLALEGMMEDFFHEDGAF